MALLVSAIRAVSLDVLVKFGVALSRLKCFLSPLINLLLVKITTITVMMIVVNTLIFR